MEDAAPDGDAAAAAANAASAQQQEGLATESADGAAAVKKEEAEEAQEVAPAGAPSGNACQQYHGQDLGPGPGVESSNGCKPM
jgi:hypothetical protein